MAHVQVQDADVALEEPVLVEGLPGVGLVGKIAADHLVDSFDMTYFASCHCEGLPDVAVYHEGDSAVRPPVRFYADESRDLLVLQSDVPVSPSTATEFAGCVTGWLEANDVLPLYLSGLPSETEGVPELYGLATGDADALLDAHDIDAPAESGLVSGPTGALLAHAGLQGLDGLGLVVQANPNFPDPESARVLLTRGIEPLAGIEVDTDELLEQAEEVSEAREQLAERMRRADDESSRAQPLTMFQ